MKRVLILILILAFAVSQTAFASVTNPIVLTENDFSSFSEGIVDFGSLPYLEGTDTTETANIIRIKDINKMNSENENLEFDYDSTNFSELDLTGKTGYSLNSDGNLSVTMNGTSGVGSKLTLGGNGLGGSQIRFKIIYHNEIPDSRAEFYTTNSFVDVGGFFQMYKQQGTMGSLQMSTRVVANSSDMYISNDGTNDIFSTLVVDMNTKTGEASYAFWKCTSLEEALSLNEPKGAEAESATRKGEGSSQKGAGSQLGDIIINNIPSVAGTDGEVTIHKISLKKLSDDENYEEEPGSRGKSILIQKKNFESGYSGTGANVYMGFMAGEQNADGSYSRSDTEVIFEFDFYWSGMKEGDRMQMRLIGEKGGGRVEDSPVDVQQGWFDFGKYGTGGKAVTYSATTWCKVKYTVNLINQTYTFEIFNDNGSLRGSSSSSLATPLDSLSELRFTYIGRDLDDVGINKFFAFDNVKITCNDILPDISDVEYVDSNGSYVKADSLLPRGITKLRLKLDAPFYATGELKDALDITVKGLEAEAIPEGIKSFKYSKSGPYIDLEFESPLKADATYTFSLNDTARTPYGNELFGEVSKTLKVGYNPVDVVSCSFEPDGETNVNAKLDFVNSTGSSSAVVVIAAVYDGNELKSLNVYDKTVAADTDTFELTSSAKTGETLEIYVWDSIQNANSITEKLFAFSK